MKRILIKLVMNTILVIVPSYFNININILLLIVVIIIKTLTL